jgi:hypothetical protein
MPARSPTPPAAWWNDRRYILLLVLLSAAPLLWPSLPPLVDALGHLARYRVELGIDSSPYLHQWFAFKWALIGNLGVDLLIIPMSKLFGLQLGMKLIAIAIPVLTASGLMLAAREAHGRIPPSAVFALPLAYSFPFQFGFLNYTLSMALALNAFVLWVRLGRARRFGLRAALFVPIGGLVWLCHVFGWAVLGILCFCAELTRDRDAGGTRWHALWRACLGCLPLAPPILLMLVWRSGDVKGMTGDWFNWFAKKSWLIEALRDRWADFDIYSVYLLLALCFAGLVRFRLRFEHMLGIATLLLAITYVLLPRILFGSAYADMRLIPYVLALGVIALRPVDSSKLLANGLAIGALIFFVARTGTMTWNFYHYDQAYDRQLEALKMIPRGSRVMVLVELMCPSAWVQNRMDHLGSQAIVRKDAFANGQWVMPGAQLLTVTYKAAGRYGIDPSQLLRPVACRGIREPILENTVAHFPREAYDFLWLVDVPQYRWVNDPGLQPIWHSPSNRGILYRIVKPQPPRPESKLPEV